MDYKKLQNGSDIRGVALEGIEGQHINLTEEVCRDIGRGFALWLCKKLGNKNGIRVAVGRDSRLSGEKLSGWICDAMSGQGLLITDFGMASTPAMFKPFGDVHFLVLFYMSFGFKFFCSLV